MLDNAVRNIDLDSVPRSATRLWCGPISRARIPGATDEFSEHYLGLLTAVVRAVATDSPIQQPRAQQLVDTAVAIAFCAAAGVSIVEVPSAAPTFNDSRPKVLVRGLRRPAEVLSARTIALTKAKILNGSGAEQFSAMTAAHHVDRAAAMLGIKFVVASEVPLKH